MRDSLGQPLQRRVDDRLISRFYLSQLTEKFEPVHGYAP